MRANKSTAFSRFNLVAVNVSSRHLILSRVMGYFGGARLICDTAALRKISKVAHYPL
jgi:hypothetical protein